MQLFFHMMLFTLLLFPLQAESTIPPKTDKSTISKLIEQVKQSKGDERRKAMNMLKLRLRSVNAQTRKQAMMQLRKSFASGNPEIHTAQGGGKHLSQPRHMQIRNMQHIGEAGRVSPHIPQNPARGNNIPNKPPQSPPRKGHP